MPNEVTFCPCGLVEGHPGKCLSIRIDNLTNRIGKYSGLSRNEEFTGFQQVKRENTSNEGESLI